MSSSAVQLSHVKKSYGTTVAVTDLSFSSEAGALTAVVGPDGAGKTTTLRMLSGILVPDAGEITILGKTWREDRQELKAQIGYLSQFFSLYGDLTVDENIEFFADIHGVAGYEKERDELLQFTRLSPFRNRLAGQLSGGMKQKLALACTLIHHPQLLLLDEPTTGVDPVSRREFWVILWQLLQNGMAIIMTTPYMDEAERAEHVVMMHQGRNILQGRPEELSENLAGVLFEVSCSSPRQAATILRGASRTNQVQLFGDRLHVSAEHKDQAPEISAVLEENDITVRQVRQVRPGLEDVFLSRLSQSGAEGHLDSSQEQYHDG